MSAESGIRYRRDAEPKCLFSNEFVQIELQSCSALRTPLFFLLFYTVVNKTIIITTNQLEPDSSAITSVVETSKIIRALVGNRRFTKSNIIEVSA